MASSLWSRMIIWLRAVWNWLNEARVFWFLVLVAVGALIVAFGAEATEARVRVTGWVLQLLGLSTVAWGIRETRQMFRRPDVLALASAWLARYPKYPKYTGITGTIGTAEERDTAHAIGHVSTKARAAPTLEDRVAALEDKLRSTTSQVQHTQRDLSLEVHNRQAALNQERQTREQQDQELERKLEVAETGGLHVSAVGLVWLALGLTLSTIPNELLCWLR